MATQSPIGIPLRDVVVGRWYRFVRDVYETPGKVVVKTNTLVTVGRSNDTRDGVWFYAIHEPVRAIEVDSQLQAPSR